MTRKPSHATVVAYLALFMALGGTAGAATTGSFARSQPAPAQAAAGSAGSLPSTVFLRVSGSFTVPAGAKHMIVEARGGGGGGGAGENGGNGAGGGQGGWARVLVTVKPGTVYSVTIGAGGAGGSAGSGGVGGSGRDTVVRPRGKSAITVSAAGGQGAMPGESCDIVFHNGPVPGGIGGSVKAATDPQSLGLQAALGAEGGGSGYLPPSCPSTPIGGNGGATGYAGAGGKGGAAASSHDGAPGAHGLVIVAFLP